MVEAKSWYKTRNRQPKSIPTVCPNHRLLHRVASKNTWNMPQKQPTDVSSLATSAVKAALATVILTALIMTLAGLPCIKVHTIVWPFMNSSQTWSSKMCSSWPSRRSIRGMLLVRSKSFATASKANRRRRSARLKNRLEVHRKRSMFRTNVLM